ncbi:hypothetical protein F5Y17DRAFT_179564 [Xylariaceae sp. FL0594]|nr:hypothetical protein F5Y17DRAFT_179564 [Xylariaceae sp. FL0594]
MAQPPPTSQSLIYGVLSFFFILMMHCGDFYHQALALAASDNYATTCFSLGLPHYVLSTLRNLLLGGNRLFPQADGPCMVINPDGYSRSGNKSWTLARFVGDHPSWMEDAVSDKVEKLKKAKYEFDKEAAKKAKTSSGLKPSVEWPTQAGLVVGIYEYDPQKRQGRDVVFWSGIAVTALQLAVATIPIAFYGNWAVFLITVTGALLSFAIGSWPQWPREKWACRKIPEGKISRISWTKGNGSQHAIVIRFKGCGFNLEDLATGGGNVTIPFPIRVALVALGFQWVALLLVWSIATALANPSGALFLAIIAGIGTLQNIFSVVISRTPTALGLPLKLVGVVGYPKVINVVYKCADTQHKVGRALATEFFPNGLRDNEEKILKEIESSWDKEEKQEGTRVGK